MIRGNYGKYLASESTNMATLNNRVNTSVNQGNRSWTDFNRNLKPDCNLQNPGAQDLSASGGDICSALDSNLGSLAIAATYDPALTTGFGVRPNDQEIAFGIQRQLVPNVSADFQFTHHWFGNFVASQDTIRVPSAYDSFCVTPPSSTANGFSLPGGTAQLCGFYNRNPNPAFTPTFLNVTRAKNFGDVSDVYTGYDVNLNARLPRGGTASGGFSLGHEVTDICDVIGKGTVTYAAVAGVLSSSAGTLALHGRLSEHAVLPCPAAVPARHQRPGQLSSAVVGRPSQCHAAESSGSADSRELLHRRHQRGDANDAWPRRHRRQPDRTAHRAGNAVRRSIDPGRSASR